VRAPRVPGTDRARPRLVEELRVRLQLGEITLAEAERELKWRALGGARGLTCPPHGHGTSHRAAIDRNRWRSDR